MKSIEEREQTSPLYGGSAPFVESLYESWLDDPGSVSEAWRHYFEKRGKSSDSPRKPLEEELSARAHTPRAERDGGDGGLDGAAQRLLDAWRLLGHLTADTDPLDMKKTPELGELDPKAHGISEADSKQPVTTDWGGHCSPRPLGELVQEMRRVYGGHTAVEFSQVSDPAEWRWLAEHIEGGNDHSRLDDEERRTVLAELTAAEGLEKYLHRRYVGQKRFSLEGGDALIPMLNDLIRCAGADGVREIIMGMAHRGRLNVLVNVLGKSPEELFSEFEGGYERRGNSDTGDVKYHLGFSSDVETDGGKTHLVLAFNPSHLEAVDPVVEGSVRARQDRGEDARGERVLPVLMHGDASLAGQGVVMETLQMSQTRGFQTGGTVHIVLNNQIGFTTDQRDARSSRYCTDIAKMIEAPVLRVNGDDPEAALAALRLAFKFRQRFGKDAFVDFVCYRRHGHNEADEPAVTQPRMYRIIRKHPTPRELYAERLAKAGTIGEKDAAELADQYNDGLEAGRVVEEATLEHEHGGSQQTAGWAKFHGQTWEQEVDTGVAPERLRELGDELFRLPEDIEPHDRAARVVSERRKMLEGEGSLDWGCAENLAYASLVTEGYPVRLTGQDCVRGPFFHRHASFHDAETGKEWTPLNHLSDDQAPFMAYDSLLSEAAVVGFEYGYSTTRANTLTLWEAQYGDFANSAQVMVDQFISSGEAKWARLCGLVMLLPHGYEGAGPEHSSARLERYLQLCAEDNWQIANCTTPANYFHILRRQLHRQFRKPLVLMTPKSLLRHKRVVSSLEQLGPGTSFHRLLWDDAQFLPDQPIKLVPDDKIRRVVLCSGKV
ncbi:MAG: 2-oxoglutarate dehydrogenase E1 component, partial [Gammaproteobacteria bacterium]